MSYSTTHQPVMFLRESTRRLFTTALMAASVTFAGSAFANWEKQTRLTAQALNAVAVDPINDKIFVGAGSGQNNSSLSGLYVSSGLQDQKTWNSTLSGNSVRSIAIAPDNGINNQKIFIAVDGVGIQKSINGGVSWTTSNIINSLFQVEITSNVAQIYISKRTGNVQKIYAFVDVDFGQRPGTKGIYVSDNDGATWIQLTVTDVKKMAFASDLPNTVYISTNSGEIKKSTDGGNNFVLVNSGLPQAGNGTIISDFVVDPMNANNMYASVFQVDAQGINGLYYSSNGGISWTLKSPDIYYHLSVSSVSAQSHKLYGVRNQNANGFGNAVPYHNVYLSLDNGTSSTKLDVNNAGLTGSNMNAITVVNDIVYVAAEDGLFIYNHGNVATTTPLARNYTLNVPAGSTRAITGQLRATPINPNDILTYARITAGIKGNMTISANGSFSYLPRANSTGADTVTFRVTDQLGRVSTVNGIISITFGTATTNTLQALNSSESVLAGRVKTGFLKSQKVNFSDVLTYTIVTTATKGVFRLTNASTGAFSYTPNANQTGSDRVTFRVRDASGGTSSVNGVLTLNLSGGSNVGTGIDIVLTAARTVASIQPGAELTHNLSLRNLSTTSISGGITITSTAVPTGSVLVQPGSFTGCLLRNNNTVRCTINPIRAGLLQTIPVILRLPTNLIGTSVSVTYTAQMVGEVNTSNNSALVTTAVNSTANPGNSLTAPTAINLNVRVIIGSTNDTLQFSATPLTPSDTLTYLFVNNDQNKGTFSFISADPGVSNQSASPRFRYSASPNVVVGQTDRISYRVIDQISRQSTIATVTVTFVAPGGSGTDGGGGTGGGSSGGAINPIFLLLGLLPLLFRRKRK